MNDRESLGLSVSVNLGYHLGWKYIFAPHYRIYFGDYVASGVFIEGSIAHYKYFDSNYNGSHFGAGLAFGYKFKPYANLVSDIYFGAGIGPGKEIFHSRMYPRIGFTLGYRF